MFIANRLPMLTISLDILRMPFFAVHIPLTDETGAIVLREATKVGVVVLKLERMYRLPVPNIVQLAILHESSKLSRQGMRDRRMRGA